VGDEYITPIGVRVPHNPLMKVSPRSAKRKISRNDLYDLLIGFTAYSAAKTFERTVAPSSQVMP
jgi:hypothetical protein